MDVIKQASDAIREGRMTIVYDGDEREGEADIIFSAKFATPQRVEMLRREAGGLICAAMDKQDADKIGLPFFTDLLEKTAPELARMVCRKTAYGDKPAFSIPINNCGVYTGITDNDRSLTLTKLYEVITTRPQDFAKEFYSPGHIFLLIGRGLENRKGHTELAVELGKRAGLNGVMVLCEMLGSGKALTKNEAQAYAKKHDMVFVEGKTIINAKK